MALTSERSLRLEKISDALQSIPTMKEELRRCFEEIQSHYSSALSSFHLQWSDIDSDISSTQTSLEIRFKKLQFNYQPQQNQQVSLSQPEQPQQQQHQELTQPSKKLKSLCIKMDVIGLRNFILSSQNTPIGRVEVTEAVSCAPDPPKLVLDSLQGIFPTELRTTMRNCMCMWMLQGVSDIGREIKPEVKEEAKKLGVEWKEKVPPKLYIQLFIAYGLKDQYSVDEWLEMIVSMANNPCSVDMCRGLGLDSEVPEIVKQLIRKTKHVDAIKFVYAFELVDMFPPAYLLEDYLKDSKQAAQEIFEKGNKSYRSLQEAIKIEISSLREAIKCINKNKLGSHFSRESLMNRIAELNKVKPSRKFGRRIANMSPATEPPWQIKNKRPRPTT